MKFSLAGSIMLIAMSCAWSLNMSQLAQAIPNGKIIWEKDNYIYYSTCGKWKPERKIAGFRPKWSPDGKQIAYSRGGQLYVMNAGFTGSKKIVDGISSGWWETGYSWTRDGKAITVIMKDKRTISKYEFSTKKLTPIYKDPEQDLAETAEIHLNGRYLIMFRLKPNHIRIWDLIKKKALQNPDKLGANCTPAWAPDGTYFTSTQSASKRPIMRSNFNPETGVISNPVKLAGGSGDNSICHFSRVSNDEKWLVFCGSPDWSKYNVYIWKIGDPEIGLLRLTTQGGRSPDIFIPLPEPQDMTLAPASLKFNAQQGGNNPPSRTVTVTALGGLTLADITMKGYANWLTVTPSGSKNTIRVLTNSVNLGALTEGVYHTSVVVEAGTVSKTYTCSLTVDAPGSGIFPVPQSRMLDFSAKIFEKNTIAVSFFMATPGNYRLSVFDIMGRRRWTYNMENSAAGKQTVLWNYGLNPVLPNTGSKMYFIRLQRANRSDVKILPVVK